MGSWPRLMRPSPSGPFARNRAIASGVIGVLLLRGAHLIAAAHSVDSVEIHRQRRIQRIVGLVIILDARDAQVRRIVAGVNHDARDRRLADFRDQIGRERRQLL